MIQKRVPIAVPEILGRMAAMGILVAATSDSGSGGDTSSGNSDSGSSGDAGSSSDSGEQWR